MIGALRFRKSVLLAASLPFFGTFQLYEKVDAGRVTSTDSVLVSASWLKQHAGDHNLVLIEAGDAADYQKGHLAGARAADIMAFHAHGSSLPAPGSLASGFSALGVSDSSRIVIYGDPMSVAILYVALDYIGMGSRTVVFEGGKAAWVAAGGQLTTRTEAPSEGHVVAHPRPDIIATTEWLTAHLHDPSLALIDARTADEYAGEGHMAGERTGHIPGARNLDWEDLLDSTAHLRPIPELQAMFRTAGYAGGDQLVVYCTVGMRASYLYMVGKVLGLSPRIYVGSMHEWQASPVRDVARSSEP
jgi:thiosulfate/3-mercaptopyruvate sulfurtransferase